MDARRPVSASFALTFAVVVAAHLSACGARSTQVTDAAPRPAVAADLDGATRAPSPADRRFDRGIEALARGDGATAHASFSEVLASDGDRIDARLNRALASLLLQRPSDAVADVDRVLQSADLPPDALRTAGGILLRAGTLGRAARTLQSALDALPPGHASTVDVLVELAVIEGQLGELDAAARRLEEALTIERTVPALTALAQIRSLAENESAAAPLYEEALDLDPFDPATLRAAATSLERRGQPGRAADLLQRLVNLLPADHPDRSTLEARIRDLRERRPRP